MRIAVISDTHDNLTSLDQVLPDLDKADLVLHCGDLISPFVVARLGSLSLPVHVIFGNNDGDQRLLTLAAQQAGNVHVHGQYFEQTVDGLTIAMNHYPEIARPLAEGPRYDLVCYGHDHQAHESRLGETTLLNPGELLGLKGRRTYAIFDTHDRTVHWKELGD
jgi:hypothetical protein